MDKHDQELRLFNDIMLRLVQIEETTEKAFNVAKRHHVDKEIENGIFLCAIWIKDVIEKFQKYSEL